MEFWPATFGRGPTILSYPSVRGQDRFLHKKQGVSALFVGEYIMHKARYIPSCYAVLRFGQGFLLQSKYHLNPDVLQ